MHCGYLPITREVAPVAKAPALPHVTEQESGAGQQARSWGLAL